MGKLARATERRVSGASDPIFRTEEAFSQFHRNVKGFIILLLLLLLLLLLYNINIAITMFIYICNDGNY